MTKTLTEQWREGTLESGWYYVVIEWNDEIRMLYFEGDYFLDTDVPLDNDNIKEVLDAVPSYEEYQKLQKKLEIATEALKKYREAIKCFKKDPMNNIIMLAHQLIYDIDTDSKQALKEMEGVK